MNELLPLFETMCEVEQEVVESEGRKNHYLKGLYSECETKNVNGRVYTKALMEREINSRLVPKIESSTAFGEFGHPKTMSAMTDIDAARVSHRIVEMHPDGNSFYGKSVLIPEGLGKAAIAMVETGGVLSVSSRGLGCLKKGTNIVENNYKLVTYDLVFNPGMKKANQTALMESREFFVGESGMFTEDEWALIEKNRVSLFEGAFFCADLLGGLADLKSFAVRK